jgi:alkanesulfonate monooxygenase SsuD/methylene tetrahydromethanopterin reductase-like flavin-dependent oxidoreductase (luciferase family)
MPGWADVVAMAAAAESDGLDSLWVCDHMISEPDDRPPEGILEGWTILSALAAATRRATIGTLVTCASFRPPALLAKMAATVDGISDGRLVLGLGAGSPGIEHGAYGLPDDHRTARFAETLPIVRALLRGETVTTGGRFHTLHHAALRPAPDRPIPLLVAGDGVRMLALAARYADRWITAWHGAPDHRLRERLDAMARALDDEGRDPGSLDIVAGVSVADPDHPSDDEDAFTGSVDEVARLVDAYAELGVYELIVALSPRAEGSVHRLAEALRLR